MSSFTTVSSSDNKATNSLQPLKGLLYLSIICIGFQHASASSPSGNSNSTQQDSKSVMDKFAKDYQTIMLLPINHLHIHNPQAKQVTLSLKIPKGFKALQSMSQPSTLLEFIPKDEDPSKWSQILTVSPYIGQRIQAADYVNLLSQGLCLQTGAAVIQKLSTHKNDLYDTAEAGLTYTSGGRKEVIYLRVYAGPIDSVALQYTVVVKEQESAQAALKRAQTQLDAIISLINAKMVNGEWVNNQ